MSPTHSPPVTTPAAAIIASVTQTGTPLLTSGMAMAADANPPSTSAPSPPIMVKPMRAGMAKARPVRISGAARCSEFWIENDDPNPPVHTSEKNVTGSLPMTRRKIENSSADTTSASTGIVTASANRNTCRFGTLLALTATLSAIWTVIDCDTPFQRTSS